MPNPPRLLWLMEGRKIGNDEIEIDDKFLRLVLWIYVSTNLIKLQVKNFVI